MPRIPPTVTASTQQPLRFKPVAPCRLHMSIDPIPRALQGHQQTPCSGLGPSPHPTPEWYPWLSHSCAGYSLISPLKGLHYFQLPRLVKTNLLSYYSLNWFHRDPSSQPSLHKSSTLRFSKSKLPTRPVQPLNSLHPVLWTPVTFILKTPPSSVPLLSF